MPDHSHRLAHVIVVVEDDDDDYMLIEEAWSEVCPSTRIDHVATGQGLCDHLVRLVAENGVTPGLILLDLNMPIVDGWEALNAIKAHDDLKAIPTVVLTTSSAPNDVCRAYAMHAAGFITKPSSYQRLVEMMMSTHSYWFETTTLAHDCGRS